MECQEVINKVKETLEESSVTMKERRARGNIGGNGSRGEEEVTDTAKTYADTATWETLEVKPKIGR